MMIDKPFLCHGALKPAVLAGLLLLSVCASTHANNAAYAQPMRAAVAALDLAGLAALLN